MEISRVDGEYHLDPLWLTSRVVLDEYTLGKSLLMGNYSLGTENGNGKYMA